MNSELTENFVESSEFKLSIVILTYERQKYVLRNLSFWSDKDVSLYILDGSQTSIAQEKIHNPRGNITYLHLPLSIAKRMCIAANLVRSEYVTFLADDEFFLPSALDACIRELEMDSNLVACCGHRLPKLTTSDLVVHQTQVSPEGTGSGGIYDDSPIKRMYDHMESYAPSSIYAVCRSKVWKHAVGAASDVCRSNNVAIEIMFELIMSFCGKIKVINQLMWIRSAEENSLVSGIEVEFDEWFSDPRATDDVSKFINGVTNSLASYSYSYTKDELSRSVRGACLNYIAFCKRNKNSDNSIKPKNKNNAYIIRKTKSFIRKKISKLPGFLLFFLPKKLHFRPFELVISELESSGIKINWIELKNILQSIRKTYKYDL
jgi:glycosyltransferase domain-containing protein